MVVTNKLNQHYYDVNQPSAIESFFVEFYDYLCLNINRIQINNIYFEMHLFVLMQYCTVLYLLFFAEQFQVSVDDKVIHIFYGNSMKELIEGIQQEEGDHLCSILSISNEHSLVDS